MKKIEGLRRHRDYFGTWYFYENDLGIKWYIYRNDYNKQFRAFRLYKKDGEVEYVLTDTAVKLSDLIEILSMTA